MTPQQSGRRLYYRRSRRDAMTFAALVTAGVAVWLPPLASLETGGLLLTTIPTVALGLALLVRAARLRIEIDQSRFTVYNLFRTYHVLPEEIADVRLSLSKLSPGVALKPATGHLVIAPYSQQEVGLLDRQVAQIRAAVREARGAH